MLHPGEEDDSGVFGLLAYLNHHFHPPAPLAIAAKERGNTPAEVVLFLPPLRATMVHWASPPLVKRVFMHALPLKGVACD